MADILFYCFTALTLFPALLVPLCRNPVNGAMAMVLTFVGMAGLFVMLEAFFLAALQVLVYAGAIVVLFLFIIMLIDPQENQRVKPQYLTVAASGLALLALLSGMFLLFHPENLGGQEAQLGAAAELAFIPPASSASTFGLLLFTRYMLPFQVAGFLLLIAMVGVVHLSKSQSEEPAAKA